MKSSEFSDIRLRGYYRTFAINRSKMSATIHNYQSFYKERKSFYSEVIQYCINRFFLFFKLTDLHEISRRVYQQYKHLFIKDNLFQTTLPPAIVTSKHFPPCLRHFHVHYSTSLAVFDTQFDGHYVRCFTKDHGLKKKRIVAVITQGVKE